MRHIKSLWGNLRWEVKHWVDEKKDLFLGLLYGWGICWLFFDRIWLLPFMIPLLVPWMKHRRRKRRQKEQEQLRREFREMMISVRNSLSAGYSLENALKTSREDLKVFQGEGLLEKELNVLIVSLKINEPVEQLLQNMAERIDLEELYQFAEIVSIVKKTGGNLIEIIGKTVDHLNQAMQIKEEIQTMIAAKQMEKRIMSVMPYMILAYVRAANPEYFQVLYESLFGTVLAAAALACLCGANLWAERVVEIEI